MRNLYEALRKRAIDQPASPIFSDSYDTISQRDLLGRIGALSQRIPIGHDRIGILSENSVHFALAQVTGAMAGKTIVPLPPFFSQEQLGHIVRDSGLSSILCSDTLRPLANSCGTPTVPIVCRELAEPIEFVEGFKQIIYTSGSTGRPKGVRLGARQIAWSTQSLAMASEANDRDHYLSIMPLSLLLEAISAVFLPALVGGQAHFPAESADIFKPRAQPDLANLFETVQPTSTVLVPQLLQIWLQQLSTKDRRAPDSLRFVAVGGGMTPKALIEAAWSFSIPVYEGYGLSECCSVVTLNRPSEQKVGTVGRPLPGLDVRIEDGEIVIGGPSVMDGYLDGDDVEVPWRTGDLGTLDEEGYVSIRGRKDNLLVTSLGRNVSPEWIETMILGDWRIALCVVFANGGPNLTALIAPSAVGIEFFSKSGPDETKKMVSQLCASAPDYAVPSEVLVMTAPELAKLGLLTPNGRFRRKAVAAHFARR
jgi:long-subunit acyl-CoA synthetase (AMP-forming)